MTADYLKLLKDCDLSRRWEFPDDFDWPQCRDRFRLFTSSFSVPQSAKMKISSENEIQDATFHSTIGVKLDGGGGCQIYFSNFGNLVTIDCDERMDETISSSFVQQLEAHGYVHIPIEILERPYSGSFPQDQDEPSPGYPEEPWDWFHRFFDWI